MRRFVTSFALLACGLALGATPSFAQEAGGTSTAGRQLNWAEQMFDRVRHEYGTVLHGADVVMRLKMTNKYKETIHVAEARTSCGCIQARLLNNTLKTWEEGYIEVRLNTLQFSGERNANVIVTIDQPAYIQVMIPIHAFIRTDVSIAPGSANMGSIVVGEPAEQRLQINYLGGQSNWRISDVKSRNPHVSGAIRELGRTVNGGLAYELSVKVSRDAPAGDIRESLMLQTNDPSTPQIPVLVEGRVVNEFSLTPPAIVLKNMKPGQKEEVKVVIRGTKPFVVDKIESNSGSEAYQIKPLPKDRLQVVQILSLIIAAPEKAGTFEEVFTVTVAGQPNAATAKKTIEFKLDGKVIADANTSTEPQRVTTAKPPVPTP